MTAVAQCGVRVGQSRVGQGVGWVRLNRLLEVRQRVLQPFFCPLIPKVAPFDIRLIRGGAVRMPLREPRALCATQWQPQCLRHRVRNRVLDRKEVAVMLGILLPRPEDRSVTHAEQPCRHPQLRTHPLEAPVQHRLDALFPPCHEGVLLGAAVLAHCTRGPNDELREGAELGDDRLRHPQPQAGIVALSAERGKRQHGERVNRYVRLQSARGGAWRGVRAHRHGADKPIAIAPAAFMSRGVRPRSPIAWRASVMQPASGASLMNWPGHTCAHSSSLETMWS